MQSEGLKVDYDRFPVTDETAPIPGIFSRIEQRVSAALTKSGKASLTMNCQMGEHRAFSLSLSPISPFLQFS